MFVAAAGQYGLRVLVHSGVSGTEEDSQNLEGGRISLFVEGQKQDKKKAIKNAI